MSRLWPAPSVAPNVSEEPAKAGFGRLFWPKKPAFPAKAGSSLARKEPALAEEAGSGREGAGFGRKKPAPFWPKAGFFSGQRKPAFGQKEAGFLYKKAGFWPERSRLLARSRLLPGQKAGFGLKEPAYTGQSRLLWPGKPALAKEAGLHRPKPALWPEEAGLHRPEAGFRQKKPAYTGQKPALAGEAGLHRLTAGFLPAKEAGLHRPKPASFGRGSRLTPAKAGFLLLAGRSRLTPANAGFFQGAACCSVLLQAAACCCVLLESLERGRGANPRFARVCGKPRRASSKGPGFSRGRFKEAFRPPSSFKAALAAVLPSRAAKRGRWPKRKLSQPPLGRAERTDDECHRRT